MAISPFIYGLHDAGGESNMAANKGWIVFTETIGTSGSGGRDYRPWSDAGYGVIVRLNNGYESSGTIPFESEYPAFAGRCASYVQASSGVDYWIIGNETNGAREWPGNVGGDAATGEAITVDRYVRCYLQCYHAIQAAAPGVKVCPAGAGTWGPPYDGTIPSLPNRGIQGFLDYWVRCLNGIGADKIGALILHAYTHGCDPAMVTSEAMMANDPYRNIHLHFRVYRDYMANIPAGMRTKPVLITECNTNVECATGDNPKHIWRNQNSGWVKAIYREIDDWNRANTQKIQCVALFRWPLAREGEYTFGLEDKDQVLADFREAVAFGYRWTSSGGGSGALIPGTPTGSNLARSATRVAADSEFDANNRASNAKDGVANTKWCSGGTALPHWLAYDLGSTLTVRGFIVRHAGWGGEESYFNTKRFTIQSSGSFDGPWTDEGSADNSALANVTSLVYASGTKSLRYVRLRVDDGPDNYARIPEFEVWGDPGGGGTTGSLIPGTPAGTNLARSASRVAADSEFDANNSAAKAKDGASNTKWCSSGTALPHWLTYDLGATLTVRGFIVRHAGWGGEETHFNTKRFTIQSSASFDGPWTDEGSADNSALANVTSLVYASGTKSLRYVRLRVDDGPDNYARIPEFEVWGDAPATPSLVGVDFDVPYVHQLWDTEIDSFDGGPACGPTCAVMVLAAMQRLSPRPTQVPRPSPHTNDWGWYVSKSYSVQPQFSGSYTFDASQLDGSNRPARGAYGACVIDQMAWAYKIYQYLERHDVGYRYEDAAARITPENLKRELDGGALIILATYIAGDPGHLIVLRGYDGQGNFIVNDPRGDYGNSGWTGSGERVTYSWQKIRGPQNRTPLYYIAVYGPQYLPRAANLTLAVQNDAPAAGQLDVRFLTGSGGLDSTETRELASGASATIAARASSFSGTAVLRPRQTGLGALGVELGSNANLDNLAQAVGPAALAAFGRIARTLYLPTVYSRIWSYDTSVRVMNAGLATAGDVQLRLLGRGGYGDGQTSFSLAPGASVEIALTSLIGTNPWVGSAAISASQALAVASRDVDTSGAARTSSAASKGAGTLYAPVVYRESYGLSSGIVVQNLGDMASEVDIELYNRDGTRRYTHALGSVAPLRAAGVFLPSIAVGPSGWAGTAVIRSRNGQPLAAQVSASKPNAGVATYNAVTAGSQRFVIPRVIKAIGGRSTSFLMQSTDTALSVEARYLDPSGATALVASYSVPARGGVGQFAGSETRLADGWSGSLVLTASAASLAVVVREDAATTISAANALPR